MVSNRKNVVNDNRIEVVQPSWFLSFVVLLRTLVDWIVTVWEYRFIVLINYENSLGCIRIFYRVAKSHVVYKISCKSCDASYIDRQLKSRITEYKNYIRWNTSTHNVITEHRLQEDHDFDWDNITILDEKPQEEIDFGQTGRDWFQKWYSSGDRRMDLNLQMDMEGLPKIDKL